MAAIRPSAKYLLSCHRSSLTLCPSIVSYDYSVRIKKLIILLDFEASSIMTYALQVQIPQGWSGDINTLGTTYLAYIPQDQVDSLSLMIRAPSSKFYAVGGVAGQLANAVVPSFPLTAASLDVLGGSKALGTNKRTRRMRIDAIIGVCASAISIAAMVAIWWTVRYIQRKNEAKHRRLSEQNDPNWNGGVYATHNDNRRTSFYYAQDQLQAGYYGVPPVTTPRAPPPGSIGANAMKPRMGVQVQQRRRSHVRKMSISTPVLQFSSIDC